MYGAFAAAASDQMQGVAIYPTREPSALSGLSYLLGHPPALRLALDKRSPLVVVAVAGDRG